ncbi:MAG: hypothetical protein CVU39_17625 [Chloroflexi bacterium HGW-Chloroflexi-10]|jgi:hypothetical protein|nr:MAG: hypothetical protein CVU39_17625 [Chloroflexi bacterium HGW-Chloroflexi-10]
MSYQEKNITVSLMSHLLIVGYYLINLFQMLQEGGLVSTRLFGLWAIVIISIIIVNIIASILTNIVLSIVHAIKTRTNETERFIADERDKLIELKGGRASYITFSIGVLLSMLTFVFGQPPLIMFSMIIFFSIAAEIIGDVSQIFLYRKGF